MDAWRGVPVCAKARNPATLSGRVPPPSVRHATIDRQSRSLTGFGSGKMSLRTSSLSNTLTPTISDLFFLALGMVVLAGRAWRRRNGRVVTTRTAWLYVAHASRRDWIARLNRSLEGIVRDSNETNKWWWLADVIDDMWLGCR